MRRNSWPQEVENYVKNHYTTMPDLEIKKNLEEQYNFVRSTTAIKAWRLDHGLSVNRPGQTLRNGKSRVFTEPEVDVITWLRATHTSREIALILQGKGYPRTKDQVRAYCKTHKLKCGLPNGTWPHGAIPAWRRAITKGMHLSPETEFKKGHPAPNKLPIGAERRNVDGYWVKKVAEPDVWIMRSKYIWESAHGPLQPDERLIRLDRNPENDSLENLRVIKQGTVARLRGELALVPGAPELNNAIISIAELERKLRIKHNGVAIR